MTQKRADRAKAFAARKSNGPSHFNRHFEIKATPSADPALTSRLGNGKARGTKGPAMKTQQWNGTGSLAPFDLGVFEKQNQARGEQIIKDFKDKPMWWAAVK